MRCALFQGQIALQCYAYPRMWYLHSLGSMSKWPVVPDCMSRFPGRSMYNLRVPSSGEVESCNSMVSKAPENYAEIVI